MTDKNKSTIVNLEMKSEDTNFENEESMKSEYNVSQVVPTEDSGTIEMAKIGFDMLTKILLCGKLGKYSLTVAVKSDHITSFLDTIKKLFLEQPSLLEIEAPINICGDTHGQFSDLLRTFDKIGFPQRSNYLFLGDYVDRGKHSIETILFLFSYRLLYPNHFFLLRGNHECPAINKVYGFYEECQRRYKNTRIWEQFQDAFSNMPLTAVVGTKILCMHGGISPKLRSLDQLRSMKRPNYQPDPLTLEIDILWSDPASYTKGWSANQRGVSYVFGSDALNKVADDLKIDLVVRAHQVVQDGYEFFGNRRLVTIFTAPHYCGQFDNAGAVMTVEEDLLCSFVVLRPRKKIVKKKRK